MGRLTPREGVGGRGARMARFGLKRAIGLAMVIGWGALAQPVFAYPPFAGDQELVDAIGKAENSVSHPYGIMVRYKNTSPRQACLNTVRHKYADWVKGGSKGRFIDYLASRYAPIGAENDPTNLNRHWKKNVLFFLERQA